jgi:type II secretory pathway component PulJ
MRTLFDALASQRKLKEQAERIASLTDELALLRRENERLKAAARRCVTCDYRLEIRRQRSDHKLLGRAAGESSDTDDADDEG